MKVTIGGDRLGSGNKNKEYLHNYGRSTHNLKQKFASSIAPGVLYPFLKLVGLRGDKFEIDLEAACRTIPTEGPLFGSFKLQLDVFQCPIRLYQGILHNNPTSIGLKMNQVKFPKIELTSNTTGLNGQRDNKHAELSNNCLLKYLGISGIGSKAALTPTTGEYNTRLFNALPMLAYYDIFKNYYSNKQEENAYVIYPIYKNIIPIIENKGITLGGLLLQTTEVSESAGMTKAILINDNMFGEGGIMKIRIKCNLKPKKGIGLQIGTYQKGEDPNTQYNTKQIPWETLEVNNEKDEYVISLNISNLQNEYYYNEQYNGLYIGIVAQSYEEYEEKLELASFELSNIDKMRYYLLSNNQLGEAVILNENNFAHLPYRANYEVDNNEHCLSCRPMVGLVTKTYQADIFNTWVNTEWIDGENGIAELTKVAVDDGAFKIDDLNLSEKLYNVLNRIAISGNTYEDWQSAVYTQVARRHIESPVYCGGMSGEIVFEEIIQTAATDGQPLGTLGGRGTLIANKGGHLTIKCDEACYIMGILSLTPRIYYTQGNEWDMTELDSMDDFHKPALDGIGFQSLLGEQMHWCDAVIQPDGSVKRTEVGKVPAWLNYMTAVDKAYGDFATTEGKGFMVLQRDYTPNETLTGIQDVTTYIEPEKFNYAFAYKELDAQNFWIQVNSKVTKRMIGSAKQIPNL